MIRCSNGRLLKASAVKADQTCLSNVIECGATHSMRRFSNTTPRLRWQVNCPNDLRRSGYFAYPLLVSDTKQEKQITGR
jgi:hypothetical protein